MTIFRRAYPQEYVDTKIPSYPLTGLLFDGQTDHTALAVKVNIFIQFPCFHGRFGGKLHQCCVCIFKVFDSHGLLLESSVEKGVVKQSRHLRAG
jgi:hypothetical protein